MSATEALLINNLAKHHIDVGIITDRLEPMLAFREQEVGLPFENILPIGQGLHQHRHGMNGSVFKLNHSRDPLDEAPIAGYQDLRIARAGLAERRVLVDPDGNRVVLVPAGYRYLTIQIRDVDAEHRAVLERGGREGRPPVTLGTVARVSFVRDPDGNWIELSQRASLTGLLLPGTSDFSSALPS